MGCIAGYVRDSFQERGYFKVIVSHVNMKPEVTNGQVSAVVTVDPGARYRLGKVELTGKPIFSQAELAPSITVHSGTIFNIREMRETLENLRRYYASRGYANVSIVPDTMLNERARAISVALDIDPEPLDQLR